MAGERPAPHAGQTVESTLAVEESTDRDGGAISTGTKPQSDSDNFRQQRPRPAKSRFLPSDTRIKIGWTELGLQSGGHDEIHTSLYSHGNAEDLWE